jgi:hypothetical protein
VLSLVLALIEFAEEPADLERGGAEEHRGTDEHRGADLEHRV